jgi:hypothetical protein
VCVSKSENEREKRERIRVIDCAFVFLDENHYFNILIAENTNAMGNYFVSSLVITFTESKQATSFGICQRKRIMETESNTFGLLFHAQFS